MTDAAFRPRPIQLRPVHARPLRLLAAAGVLGLLASPLAATTASAVTGDIKVAEHGATPDNSNDPHIAGCSFDVQAFNVDQGSYAVTFTTQAPAPAGIASSDYGFSGPGQFVIPSDGDTVTHSYVLVSKTGNALPAADFHIKVELDAGGDKVNSKVFWLDECAAQPPTEPSATPTTAPSAPGTVNAGLAGDSTGGLVALGVGGVVIAGLGALGLRRRAGH
ncbi:hypothetical protein [Raineyella sp. LH-20]|uniref:hypothetical protein n=1 Tax=Raineyella sp. LH-20 TaxID=3081204 RepID=UPI002953F0F7|nr:hypothetical protein [Raineyella sp. LH-20]WOP19052.1 hypothetical protein R0146_01895 [Raineyella sp. LH-20]